MTNFYLAYILYLVNSSSLKKTSILLVFLIMYDYQENTITLHTINSGRKIYKNARFQKPEIFVWQMNKIILIINKLDIDHY